MTARQRGWLLPPAALTLVAGVFLGRITEDSVLPLAACAFMLAAVLLLRRTGRLAACIAFCFALGVFSGSLAFHPSLPPENEYDVRGVIADEVSSGSFGQVRLYLSDVTLDGRPCSGKAYWTFYDDTVPEDLLPGKAVSFRASLYHSRGADNPDGYNFREALLQRGVTFCLYGNEGLEAGEPGSFSFAGTAAALRHSLSASLIRAFGEETGTYASALLLGMRSLIPSEDRQAFSRLGIAHILSVSGFHTGLLIGVLAALFRLLRLRQGIRLAAYSVLLFCYAALCGLSQPVIRASLLLLLTLEGRILNRPRSGIHLLSAALFLMTLLSPVQVTSASFQLTFCAMLGLVWFSPLLRRLQSVRGRILRTAAQSLTLTFGIQLGLLFPELLFFQRLPLLVFLVNLPAVFCFSILILLFWAALILLPVPGLSALIAGPLSTVTGFLLSGVRYLGSLPGLTLWIHTPTVLTALGVILLFAGFCSFVPVRRVLRAVLLALGSAVLVLSLLPETHTSTEYIQFSAGNADAAVIRDREKVYVVDTGEDDGTLSGYLRAHRLVPDAVIITHLHADHAGGLKSMMDDGIPVRLLLLPEGAEDQQVHPDFLSLLRDLRESGTEIRYLSRGDILSLPSGLISVLWPEKGRTRIGQDANNYSLVFRLVLKETVLLQAGDISGTYEDYCSAPANILKASHHGSPYSTQQAFLDSVSPDVILLSCRRLSRLQDFRDRVGNVPVYGTPESGAVTVRFEEGAYTVIPFLNE